MLRLLTPLFGTLICCSAAASAAAPQRECPVEDFDFAQRLEAVRSAPSCEVAVELLASAAPRQGATWTWERSSSRSARVSSSAG